MNTDMVPMVTLVTVIGMDMVDINTATDMAITAITSKCYNFKYYYYFYEYKWQDIH